MPELSLYDIDQISRDVRKQDITFSHLLDDLIDHVCCDVEHEMQNGLNFSEAYRRVKQKMGSRRLKEIQELTLYAVDVKYRHMKTTMKISGVAGTVLFGFAALLKIQHWPGAGILLTLGALTLALVFLPSALIVLWKETHNTKRLFLFISAFLTGLCFIGGTLFKIQHWPGAGPILILGALAGIVLFIPALLLNRMNDQENRAKRSDYILGAAGFVLYVAGLLCKIQHWPLAGLFMVVGLLLLCVLAFPLYTWITWKEENHISPMFIFMVVGFILIIIPGAIINLNLQRSYQNSYYPNNEQQNAMYNYLYRNNSSVVTSYHDSLCGSKLEQLHSRTTGLLTVISNVQEMMVRESEGEPGKPAVSAGQIKQTETGNEILYKKLARPFTAVPVRDYLLPGCKTRQDISLAMAGYMDYLTGLIPGEDTGNYKSLLDPSTYLPGNDRGARNISLMAGLHSLEVMKNGILTAESCVLNEIARHK
ncbi:MAG: hypothetical protein ABSG89_05755 [Bacteroidales bacterium]|jgi:hypothetical protein